MFAAVGRLCFSATTLVTCTLHLTQSFMHEQSIEKLIITSFVKKLELIGALVTRFVSSFAQIAGYFY